MAATHVRASCPLNTPLPLCYTLPHHPPSPQLPSKRQIMAKILREREEAAAMKQDPSFVDPDQEARARLRALTAGGGAPALPFKTAQDELRELEERERQEELARQGAAGGGAPAAAAAGGEDGEERRQDGAAAAGGGEQADGEGEGGGYSVEPTAGMNARQKKLWELQQRMKAARKANEHAVVAEKKKAAAAKAAEAGPEGGGGAGGNKRKWFEEKQKKKVGGVGLGGGQGVGQGGLGGRRVPWVSIGGWVVLRGLCGVQRATHATVGACRPPSSPDHQPSDSLLPLVSTGGGAGAAGPAHRQGLPAGHGRDG